MVSCGPLLIESQGLVLFRSKAEVSPTGGQGPCFNTQDQDGSQTSSLRDCEGSLF
jgi:hypothetical protein